MKAKISAWVLVIVLSMAIAIPAIAADSIPLSGDGFTFDPTTGTVTVTTNDATIGWRTNPATGEPHETKAYWAVKAVVIADGVTSIKPEAFQDLGISSVIISSSVKEIGNCAFNYIDIQSIVIPASVTFIDRDAFSACESLKTVTFLGKTPPSFGESSYEDDGAFSYDSGITTFIVPKGSATAYTKALGDVSNTVFITGTDGKAKRINILNIAKVVEASAPEPEPVTKPETSAITTELGNKISWTPETPDTGYWIYRSTEKGKTGERINEKPLKGGSFVDVNVDSNTTYYYTIVKDGDSPDKTPIDVVELKTGKILGEDAEGKKNFILMQMGKDTMNVNGEVIEIDPGRGTAPIGLNGRTLVPIGAIINVMGGTAEWNGTEKKISISASGHDIAMWVGRKDILVDGATKQMDVEPQFTNGRTLLPLKFVAENLDSLATWVGSTQEIIMVFYT